MTADPIQLAILAQQWADKHWWLAFWLAFWALLFAFGIVHVAIAGPMRLVSRALFTLRVLVRGYPPENLDATGDWKKPQERPPLEREERVRAPTPVGDRETVIRYYREEKAS